MTKRILFQGDSITDCGRDREDFFGLGTGYPALVKEVLEREYPAAYECLNRGVSGNRVVDVYARIKQDFINLKPDFASIYVGVNDVWHEISRQNGVETKKFEKIYRMMIEEVYEALPSIQLALIAPYVLLGSATLNTEDVPDRWERFSEDVAQKAEVCERLGAEFHLPIVRLQPVFDKALEREAADYWSVDGVHPTAEGHKLILGEWMRAFEAWEK